MLKISQPFHAKHAIAGLMVVATVFVHFNVMAFGEKQPKQLSVMTDQFMQLDADHDQRLDAAEASGDWDIAKHFNKADFNGDGVLQLREYTNYKSAIKIITPENSAQLVRNGLVINGVLIKG